jgi:hypothetical protein
LHGNNAPRFGHIHLHLNRPTRVRIC